MFEAISIVCTIFVMIGIGALLAKLGWLPQDKTTFLAKLVVQVALPANILANMMAYYDRTTFFRALPQMLVPFAFMLIGLGLAEIFARIIRVPIHQRGLFRVMFAFSNTVFIGVPVATAIFGEVGVPIALLCYVPNTVLFWTLGVSGIRSDGGATKQSIFSKETMKNVLSPPLITFALAVLLLSFQVPLPKFILDAARYLGTLVTPLSLLFTGAIIFHIGLSVFKVRSVPMLCMLFGRFILSPLLCYGLCLILSVPPFTANVFLMQAGMPTMSQTTIVARLYGADERFATAGTAISTVASLLFIPLYTLLFR